MLVIDSWLVYELALLAAHSILVAGFTILAFCLWRSSVMLCLSSTCNLLGVAVYYTGINTPKGVNVVWLCLPELTLEDIPGWPKVGTSISHERRHYRWFLARLAAIIRLGKAGTGYSGRYPRWWAFYCLPFGGPHKVVGIPAFVHCLIWDHSRLGECLHSRRFPSTSPSAWPSGIYQYQPSTDLHPASHAVETAGIDQVPVGIHWCLSWWLYRLRTGFSA